MSSPPSPEAMLHAVYRQHVANTYPDLDRWRDRSKQEENPEPGSELEGDSVVWPVVPFWELARVALGAGVQHLNLARRAIDADDYYPIAHFSVLRGAVLGASRAVWMLAPDDRVSRQQRGLRVLDEFYRRYHQWIVSPDNPHDPAERASASAQLLARRAEARLLWAASTSLTASEEMKETKVIGLAADFTFASNAGQAAAMKIHWTTMSGDAHGLGWSMFTRQSTQVGASQRTVASPTRMATYSGGGDITEIGDLFVGAHRLLRRGWSLFDQRATA